MIPKLSDEQYSKAFLTMLKYHKDSDILDSLLAQRMSEGILTKTNSKKKENYKILSIGVGSERKL